MIYALNMTGSRDMDLTNELMLPSLRKYCPTLHMTEKWNCDNIAWGNGAGWEASMIKIDKIKTYLRVGMSDTDFILCVDSDVVFCSSDVFDYVDPKYGIIGIQNATDTHTVRGFIRHMSGCLIFLRADIAKKIAAMGPGELDLIRGEFKAAVLCENEDIVLSYLAYMHGAKPFNLPEPLYNGDFEIDLMEDNLKSFYHLNYAPTQFLGHKVTGKWQIPMVLKKEKYKL